MDYFTSDWHIGHRCIIGLSKRPFKDVAEMNAYISDMVLNTAHRGDSIYFMGDIGVDKDAILALLQRIHRAKIEFHWILGNHDDALPLTTYAPYCASIGQARTLHRKEGHIYLHHFPCVVWNNSFRNSYHLYGHVHAGSAEVDRMGQKMGGKSLNVNLEFHDYRMWTMDEVKAYMANQPDNWDIIKEDM